MNTDLHVAIRTTFVESLDVQRNTPRRSLPRYAKRLRLKLAAFFYMVPVMWRVVSHRWCVFQDAPDWVVHLATIIARRRRTAEISENGEIFLAEALDEWQLRKRKRNQARKERARTCSQ